MNQQFLYKKCIPESCFRNNGDLIERFKDLNSDFLRYGPITWSPKIPAQTFYIFWDLRPTNRDSCDDSQYQLKKRSFIRERNVK